MKAGENRTPLVRMGIAGVGAWGRNLLRNALANPDIEVAAICDPDAKARESALRQTPQAASVASYEELLLAPKLDAVILATPAAMHAQQALDAMNRGLHVLVEKPLCRSVEEGIRLVRAVRDSGRTLLVGHTFIYSNLVHEVKRRISSGELGRIQCIYGQRLNLGRVRDDVDVMWNFAPHDLSIIGFLLEEWPVSVSAKGACLLRKDSGILDLAFLHLDHASGIFASAHVSWIDPLKVRRMVVVGSEKMLVYDDVDVARPIEIYDKSVAVEFRSHTRDYAEFTTRVRAGDIVTPHVRVVEPLQAELAHFVECIRTGAAPRSDVIQGLRVVAVLEALDKSARSGGAPVVVSYPQSCEALASVARRPPANAAIGAA